ncbi:class I SAM-dependent methyltransferase [Rasiella sp. SM2506]|uniref:class I SAM-dependent methyltransferase n=1 Tax=Rasiella sp. SM2506 TaxID=3423914 RepID=UPI003D7B7D15
MTDILGRALLDYHNGNYTEDIITTTNISEDDTLPLPYLYRSFSEMPKLEQRALKECQGKILDVGCGAGSHSLWLQEKELQVKAIDISEGAIKVAKARGIQNAVQANILEVTEETFNTILLLMNGTGIFETVEKTTEYLQHLKSILAPKGQLLIDSSDLQYMYDRNEDGSIWVPQQRYYGELEFTMRYKGETSAPFPWLYLHETLFQKLAEANEFTFEIVKRGKNFDYLARLTHINIL